MLREVDIADPWDFEQVYTALLDFATHYPFDTENEEYLVHITTGTHVVQICWFLLTEASYLPARLIQTAPRHDARDKDPAGCIPLLTSISAAIHRSPDAFRRAAGTGRVSEVRHRHAMRV